jgi:hypothetical protein
MRTIDYRMRDAPRKNDQMTQTRGTSPLKATNDLAVKPDSESFCHQRFGSICAFSWVFILNLSSLYISETHVYIPRSSIYTSSFFNKEEKRLH